MTPTPRKPRHWLRITVVLLCLGALCGIPAWCIFSTFWLPDIEMHHAVKIYPDAKFLFEDFDYVFNNASKTTLIYWTSASSDTVEAYFAKTLETTFVRSEIISPKSKNVSYWIITSYQLNGERHTPPTEEGNFTRTHGIVCGGLKCISISLLKADQPDLCHIPIIFSLEWSSYVATPYVRCAELPKTGTLIVYQYYLDAM